MTAKGDFSKGSVKRLVMAQALPLTVAQTVNLLYNIVDRIYIGHLDAVGDLALTGLGVTFPVIVIIAAFTSLFASGGSVLFSIARGKGDDGEASVALNNTFSLLCISSVVLFSVCFFLRRPILFLFGAGEQSFYYADEYLRIYLFGTAFSMLTTGLNGFINAQGFPRIGMLTTVIGAVINVVLDPVFIFFLGMGVRGAALATVISQAVSAIWVLSFLCSKKMNVRLSVRRFGVKIYLLRKTVSLGLPGFVMQGTNSLVQIVCNNQLQAYGGEIYVGIMTVLMSVREMVSVPMMSISQGSQPIMSYNYGAKEYSRVKECIRFSTVAGIAYTLVAWGVVMLIPNELMAIFTDSAETVNIGAKMLNIYFFGFFFMTFQSSGQTTFLALGKAKQAIFFSLFRKAIIVVPLTLLLPLFVGVEGVFLAEPISNAVGGLAAFTAMWFMIYRKI